MKPYPSYEETDQFWIPEIPESWKTIKIKNAFSERSEKGYPKEQLLVSSQNMGVVPKNVYGNRTVEAQKDLHLLKLVRVGDFVISLRSFQGGIEYAYYQGIISPAYTIMIPRDVVTTDYFRHLAKSYAFIQLLKNCVTGIREGQNIDYSKLKNYRIPLPPRDEQEQIVRFLDWKASAINRLINVRKKQIEKLEELKRAVVSRAVTRGLNPSAPMKDSGVKWIGEIPEHWEKRFFEQTCREKCVKNTGNVESNVLSLSYGCVIKKENVYSGLVASNFSTYQIVQRGDIILRFTDLQNDHKSLRTGLVTQIGIITSAYVCIVPTINSEYLHYLLHAYDVRKVFYGMGSGVRQSIGYKDVRHMIVPVPPPAEQAEIVTYLDEQTAKIDTAILNKQAQIEALHNLKTRLISDVVTGKMDVRGIEIPEYEYAEEQADADGAESENRSDEAEREE